jgi:hypothetical protein
MTAFRDWDREVEGYEPPKDGKGMDNPKLPPGEYQLIVEGVKYVETSKGPALIWLFCVPGGHALEGRKHEKFSALVSTQNRNYAWNDFLVAGLDAKTWTQALASLKKLEGRVLACKVAQKDGYTNTFINALLGEVADEIPF